MAAEQAEQTGNLRKKDTPFLSEVFGHVSGTTGKIWDGAVEMYHDWRAHTNDSDTILQYGAFALSATAFLGFIPALLGGIGGDNVFGRTLRASLAIGFSAIAAGTAAEMANGKGFGAAVGNSVSGAFDIGKQLATSVSSILPSGKKEKTNDAALPAPGAPALKP